VIIDAYPSIDG